MSFDWGDYLTLASDLQRCAATSASPEAWLRSSLSRAYYAAFQIARHDLQSQGRYPPPARTNEHAFVRDAFLQDVARARRKIGLDLDRLRQDRNKADYDDAVPGLGPMVNNALNLAKRVLLALGHP